MRSRGPLPCLLVLLAVLLAGCGGSGAPTDPRPDVVRGAPARTTTTSATTATVPEASTSLVPAGECATGDAFSCSTLRVPLSRTGASRGMVNLPVAVQRTSDAPRGVLLLLTGGPGQAGLAAGPALVERLGEALTGYRVVVLDQRGTGADAISCRELQGSVGSSDLAVAPAGAVEDCARRLGALRGELTTQEVVADLEALRVALGAPQLTVAGISYGTYVAERYAIAHPQRVRRLLLDSVVGADGVDVLQRSVLAATPRVLHAVCARSRRCAGDPVSDLRRTLARPGTDAPALLDAIVDRTIGRPRLDDVPAALHAAARGEPAALDALIADARAGRRVATDELSAGVRAATLCAEARTPWGSATTLPADREQALAVARDRLRPADLGGWDAAAATGNGLVDTCRRWPPSSADQAPAVPRATTLPPVPTLLLAGGLDLSTPLADARAQLAASPGGTLLELPRAGHSILLGQAGRCVRRATRRFLAGRLPGTCS